MYFANTRRARQGNLVTNATLCRDATVVPGRRRSNSPGKIVMTGATKTRMAQAMPPLPPPVPHIRSIWLLTSVADQTATGVRTVPSKAEIAISQP